jgi:methylated-DNA-[protein]-cysteine S-methyltransferase
VTAIAAGSCYSPLGTLGVRATGAGLLSIRLPGSEPPLERRLGDGDAERILADALAQLAQYFAGRRRSFDLALDLAPVGAFQRDVLDAMRAIPYGETWSYRELAVAAGHPSAFRATGHACATNPIPIVIPCHRVVASGGGLGGFSSGLDHKRTLLALEGAIDLQLALA